MSVELKGMADVKRRLAALTKSFPEEAGRALRAEAEIEMTEAKKRTPVLTGALRASGHVTGPQARLPFSRAPIEVKLAFGGPAAPYALFVHENLEAFHAVGQAKYLESVLNESAPHMPARIAHRIQMSRGGE